MAKRMVMLDSLFDGKRRECQLQDLHVLKNEAGERRMQLSVEMPLSGKSAKNMPEIFSEQYLLMEKEKSATNLAKVEVIMEGATVRIYAVDKSEDHTAMGTGATIKNFRMTGDGIDNRRTVSLGFVVYLPYTVALRNWACDHLHSDFWIEVEATQESLPIPEETTKKPKQQKLQVQ